MMENNFQPRMGLFSTLEFCSHAVLEGLAIGVSFQLQFGLGVFIAAAVISHDFCDGISTLALMLNSGNSLKSSIGMLFVDATAPVQMVSTRRSQNPQIDGDPSAAPGTFRRTKRNGLAQPPSAARTAAGHQAGRRAVAQIHS